ncbi:MAG: hypothetical protein ACI870_000431 [Crocinitomicaceae bacterium]|jgi:hypothetical protein
MRPFYYHFGQSQNLELATTHPDKGFMTLAHYDSTSKL